MKLKLSRRKTIWERCESAPEAYPADRTDLAGFVRWCHLRQCALEFENEPDGPVYKSTAEALLNEHRIKEALTLGEYEEYCHRRDKKPVDHHNSMDHAINARAAEDFWEVYAAIEEFRKR